MTRLYGYADPEGAGEGRCRKCGVTHPPIVQAVPDKPIGYGKALAADLFVILLVIVAVLLWVVSQV